MGKRQGSKCELKRRVLAIILVIVTVNMAVFTGNNIVFASEYENNSTVIYAGKFLKQGNTQINGRVETNVKIPQLSHGICTLLNQDTEVYNDFEYGNNEYCNQNSIVSDGKISINANKITLANIIMAEKDISLNASSILSDDYTIIYSKTGNINFAASNIEFNGIIYAPNGKINIQATTANITGKLIGSTINTNTGYLEVNGQTQCDNMQQKLEFLSDDTLLKIDVEYNEENKTYKLELKQGQVDVFRNLEIYVRYDQNQDFEKLCDYEENLEFTIEKDFKTADIVLKGIMISGKVVYSNIDSFSTDENGLILYSLFDTDEDGIEDGIELLLTHTDPYKADSDGDGIDDYSECFVLYSDPNSYTEDADYDNDGLSNAKEIEIGTDPFLADCDFDGILDGEDSEPLIPNGKQALEKNEMTMKVGKYDVLINGYDENGNIYEYIYDPINGLVKSRCYNETKIFFFYDKDKNQIVDIREDSRGIRINNGKYDDNKNQIAYTNNNNVYEFEYDEIGSIISTRLNGNLLLNQEQNKVIYGNGDSFYSVISDTQKNSYINDICVNETIYDQNGNAVSHNDNVAGITYNYGYSSDNIILNNVRTDLGYELEYSYDDSNYNVQYSYDNDKRSQTVVLQENSENAESNLISGADYRRSKNENIYNILISSDKSEQIINMEYVIENNNIVELIGNNKHLQYTYNENNQILEITNENEPIVEYKYNAVGQLIKTIDYEKNEIEEYSYDLYNNIKKVVVYDRVSGDVIHNDEYLYNDEGCFDRVSSYNGQKIEYDKIGNPVKYLYNTFLTWNGKQLAEVTDDENTIQYTYSFSGVRTSKNINGIKTYYFYDGSDIVAESRGGEHIWYIYDDTTNVIGFIYKNQEYYYIKNATNDIISVINNEGEVVCDYKYDAWGNITDIEGDLEIANINPFRYKSYYYDVETGWYYLQTRYYNPELRRFLNMDDARNIIDASIDPNLYAYCCNDPVNMYDANGEAGVVISIFTISQYRDESVDYLKDSLKSSFSKKSPQVYVTAGDDPKSFATWWNDRIDYDILFINTHGDATHLYNGSLGSILQSDADTGSTTYKNLKMSNVKIVVILGCNCGHWNYLDKNVAYRIATKLNKGIVVASDGTVYAHEEYHLFERNDIYYTSKKDNDFNDIAASKDTYAATERDNYGWMTYSKVFARAWTFNTMNLRTSFIYNLYNNNTYLHYK